MKLSNRTYDILKFIAQLLLPAIGTLIFALSSAWGGWSWAEPVVGTIAAVDVFLGTLLKISTDKYNAMKEEEYNGLSE